jgi:hypothetical protein
MADWNRDTPWRQGHVLTNESSVALGVVPAEDAGTALAIVISHDCDLAQSPDTEPTVEIIVAKRVQAADGNFTHAKNSRRLHLECGIDGAESCLDMQAQDKVGIKKSALAAHKPAAKVVIKPEDRSVLQRWLAARYRRAAFPDEFEQRLNDTGVAKRIAKIVEPLAKELVAVFFDVDDGTEQDRKGENDLYGLRIDLLYSTENDPAVAQEAAEKAAAAIAAAFRERCFDAVAGWKWIELLGCEAISDEAMTYAMSTQLKRWNMDYLSLRADPPAEPMQE